MGIDIAILIIAGLFFVRGFSRGFVVSLFAALALLLGIVCAMAFSAKLALYLQDSGYVTSAWAPILSYPILFFGVLWGVRFLAKLVENLGRALMLGWVNKALGGLVFTLIGLLVMSCFLWMMRRAHLLSPETILHSKLYAYVEPIAPWFFAHIGKLLPFAQNVFGDLRDFFDTANKHLPEHVGAD